MAVVFSLGMLCLLLADVTDWTRWCDHETRLDELWRDDEEEEVRVA